MTANTLPTPQQAEALRADDVQIAGLRRTIAAEVAKVEALAELKDDAAPPKTAGRTDFAWIDDALPQAASPQGDGVWDFVGKPAHPVHSGRLSLRIRAQGRKQRFFDNAGHKLRVGPGDALFAYVYIDASTPPRELMLQWHTNGGWTDRVYWGENLIDWGADGTPEWLRFGDLPAMGCWTRLEVPVADLKLAPDTLIDGWGFTQHDGTVYWDKAGINTETPQDGQLYSSLSAWLAAERVRGAAGLAEEIKALVALDRSGRSESQTKQLRTYFVEHAFAATAATLAPLRSQLEAVEKHRKELEEKLPTTLVFREKAGTPKPAFVLNRGEYDRKGEKVERGVPAFLPPLPPGAPVNRLGLAEWLIAPGHPLTARVAANRLWLQVFGTGIVKTAEDFGAQGEPPSHPELLDWLAVQFREDGWDVKQFMKRLVSSAAYRQSSRVTPEALAKDPANRLLSRGPRFRLDAEMLRDQALFAAGLLIERLGGPSVKPPQPSGLWEAVAYTDSNTAHFQADTGADKVHRRSIYTFWKRTSPPTTNDHVRRALARIVPGAPRAHQHSAPGPAALERTSVHRGGPRPGRANTARGWRS